MRTRAPGLAATMILGSLAAAAPAAAAGAPPMQPYQAYSVGSSPESVVVADVNADARPDVVLSTSFYFDVENDFKLFVFLQQPDGTLAPPTRHATDGAYGDQMALAAGDLNGDLVADVALATSAGVNIFPGGPAGLGSRSLLSVDTARQVVAADVNLDQRDDLVVATGEGVSLFFGGPSWSPPVPVTSVVQQEIEVGDVTGDGLPDIVGFTGATVHVFRNQPTVGFVADGDYPAVVDYWPNGEGLAVGDLTGDGREDVALSIGGNRPGSLMNVFEQTADGRLAPPLAYPAYDIPEPVDLADMNGDGTLDIVTLHGGWNRAGVYPQVAGDLAGETLYEIPYASHYGPKGLDVGDVNGDRRPDIVLADYNSGLIVLRNGGSTPPPPPPPPPPDTTPPETTISEGPSGTVSSATVTFSFSADEAQSTFACALDGQAYQPCASPTTYSELADGSHTFRVRATDPAGNTDPTPATRTFTTERPSDLIVDLSATPDPVKTKGRLTYRLIVANRGPGANTAVSVSQSRPSGTSGASVTSGAGSCTTSGVPVVVSCTIGSMAVGATATVDVSVKVDAKKGAVLTSTAQVTGARTDPVPANNSDSVSTGVR
ncbi:MAG TPA: FG-GAP-like repeat-containing protein [Acidimicrobiales bacterium]